MDATKLLVVEDEPLSREMLLDALGQHGYRVTGVADLAAAMTCLEQAPVDYAAVLLDRMLPDGDGLELLRRIKSRPDLAETPVILQTAMSALDDVRAGLTAGAYYYLTKPFDEETLLAIVRSAVNDHRERHELRRQLEGDLHGLASLDSACFRFRTPEAARDIAALLAKAAPDPERVVLGLSELMLNAVEHGNLGISYDEKTVLIATDRLPQEIAARLAHPAFAGHWASIEFRRAAGELVFRIRDEGKGFNWRDFLEIHPDRAFDTHGRGIAMSRMISFDRLEYLGAGNEVEAAVRLPGAESVEISPPSA